MPGHIWFHLVAVGHIWLHQVTYDYSWLHQVIYGYSGLYCYIRLFMFTMGYIIMFTDGYIRLHIAYVYMKFHHFFRL